MVDMEVQVEESAPVDTLRHAQEEREEQNEKQEELEAETYIWIAGQHRLEDKEWDFDEFVREKMWRWAPGEGVGGPEDEEGEAEDEGFEDVRRAVEEKRRGEGEVDPTGGRLVGGSFEDAVKQSRSEGGNEEVVRSAV